MASDQLKGHISIAAAYTIFGLNVVLCKDIANSEAVNPFVLFTLRAIGATAIFWLMSLFAPKERVEKGDLWKKAGGVAVSLAGVFFLIFNSVHSGGASAPTPPGGICSVGTRLEYCSSVLP